MRHRSPRTAEVSNSSTHARGVREPYPLGPVTAGHSNLSRPSLGQSSLDRIGQTPLLRFARITHDLPGAEILGKAEWLNPGGSVKDRAAANIIAQARVAGKLG